MVIEPLPVPESMIASAAKVSVPENEMLPLFVFRLPPRVTPPAPFCVNDPSMRVSDRAVAEAVPLLVIVKEPPPVVVILPPREKLVPTSTMPAAPLVLTAPVVLVVPLPAT